MKRWRFYRRMPVYTADGRRLGRTEEIDNAVECLHIQQGRLLVRDWYVPLSAVRDVTTQGVYLRVNPRDLQRNRWHVPPEDYLRRQGATPGYEEVDSACSTD